MEPKKEEGGEAKQTITKDDEASDQVVTADHATLQYLKPECGDDDTYQDDAENDISNNESIALPLSNHIKSPTSCNHQCMPEEITILKGEDALRHRLWESSRRLVQEGEKNVTLALDLEISKSNLDLVRKEIEQIRFSLLQGISDGELNMDKCLNIPLVDLLRIRLQEDKDAIKHSLNSSSWNFRRKLAKTQSDVQSSTNESQVKIPYNKPSDTIVHKLKQRIMDMAERNRKEREVRTKLQRDISIGNEKVEALSDHIEKLMVHLKYEALSKARALVDRTRAVREIALLKKRNEVMEKRNLRKDAAVAELKNGGKILEDQLQLMDEKYMELRIKLDWSRTHTERMIKKKNEQVRELRSKFVLATNLMTEKGKKVSIEKILKLEVNVDTFFPKMYIVSNFDSSFSANRANPG